MAEKIKNFNLKTCGGCLNDLQQDEKFIVGLGQQWHSDCFCRAVHNWYFEKDGVLFCKEDYVQRFGEACQQCNTIISGPIMVAGDHKYHPECFCCTSCKTFIGYGESYTLLERSKLYCDPCYNKQMLQPVKGNDSSRKPLHAIRLVEVPRDVAPSLRLSVDTVSHSSCGDNLQNCACNLATFDAVGLGKMSSGSNTTELFPAVRISELICRIYGRVGKYVFSLITSVIDQCCGAYRIDVNLTNLHVGDRILEVNGTPVSNNSIEQIDNLIRSTEKILQLTVEHDPVQVCRSCSNIDIKKLTSELSLPLATSASSVEVFGREFNKSQQEYVDPKLTKKDKERIYKRKDEGYISGTKTRQLRKYKNLSMMIANEHDELHSIPAGKVDSTKTLLRDKERCSSMSKLTGERHVGSTEQMYDLSRTRSFRVEPKPQRIFRAADLVIGELLGKGFFGQVYKVTHRLTKEVMVLKELYRVDEEAQRNFLKEVAVLRSLNHPNVLKFIGVLYKEKRLHLVTEYVAGGSLKELIHDSGLPLSWTERISFAKDIACGMSYLHSKNIIHRDLNSLNCLVRENRTIIVADFGLARIITTPTIKWCGGIPDSQDSKSNTLTRSKSRQRRQRYTVVGNPYWMAPEMMKGLRYDEKVDLFSFGIMLCEIIGRVQADPDYLPRTSDFGLNQKIFCEKFCHQCPEPFYKIAFLCCDLNPDKRPSFDVLELWLDSLKSSVISKQLMPEELLYDIENYKGFSISSTPVDLLTPKSNLSRENLDEVESLPFTPQSLPTIVTEAINDTEVKCCALNLPDDIPKSPHLGKDFSPTGERIHNSMRAKRRQRFLQAQNAGLTDVEEIKLGVESNGKANYVEKGFLINFSQDGDLHLNNVENLNNYSDLDSSCETSLTYQEIDQISNADQVDEVKGENTILEQPAENSIETVRPRSDNTPAKSALNDRSYRNALDDIRVRLNLCKARIDNIDEANRRNFSNSQTTMRSVFKMKEEICKSPPQSIKMFERFKGLPSVNFASPGNASTEIKHTYRVNQTPVFGRKKFTEVEPKLKYHKPHSDSLENIDKMGIPQQRLDGKSSPKRVRLPKEESFKSYIAEKQNVSPPIICTAPKSTRKKEKLETGQTSVKFFGVRRNFNLTLSPKREVEEKVAAVRRPFSPTKSSEAKKVSAAKPEIQTSGVRNRSSCIKKISQQMNTSSNRSNNDRMRLSERIHEQKKSRVTTDNLTNSNVVMDTQKSAQAPPTQVSQNNESAASTKNQKRLIASRSQFYTRC
ncbi:LIM domain kinase 1 isoform X1 [Glossina fuscipes]|uniref:non-specific serine/threonine protein kinase n=1 Tax=Glossina fuscipes TaxID=7396 RepID=A0A9C6DPT9_9MUSC|nr:LIM domain kinase 1 isoform X1 [Glossina fuscipes]